MQSASALVNDALPGDETTLVNMDFQCTNETSIALSVAGLNLYYGESHTLWDITLELPQGSSLCIMGRNGVGKTTLLKAVMGLLPIHSGSIKFNEVQLVGRPAPQRARLGIGYVPQGRDIFPLLSVEENLKIGLYARRDKLRDIPEDIFQLFPVLKKMLRRRGGDLSGGQQQQLAIARALCIDPKILILDEPTEGIQPNIVREIGDLIVQLNQEKQMTVLLVEQKLAFAQHAAQRFCILEKGRVAGLGKMSELDNNLVTRYLTV